MSNEFFTLVTEIASQLDGAVNPDNAGNCGDHYIIDLANEREGLAVVCRRGYNAERSRARFSMSLQKLKGDADFRELPKVYELETAAAISRGARVIAAQVETKIIQPAIPMRDAWVARLAVKATEAAQLAASIARYRESFPTARIEDDGEIYLSRPGGGYVSGEIHNDGSLYVRRISSIPEATGRALLASFMECGK